MSMMVQSAGSLEVADRVQVEKTGLRSKAETLQFLEGRLATALVLPQVCFSISNWRTDPDEVLTRICSTSWGSGTVIVRSSAKAEDQEGASLAGSFLSVGNVTGADNLRTAVCQVEESYGLASGADQIFVQPMVLDTEISGVLFTCDPNTGSDYFVVNYNETSDTAAVTSGQSNNLRTHFHVRGAPADSLLIGQLCALVEELEANLPYRPMDIEFCQTKTGELILLQVRPLVMSRRSEIPLANFYGRLSNLANRVAERMKPHPHLYGGRTVFGTMPDWNPAEIVGTRPRPLATSLYRHLIMDGIWASQRAAYGYRDISGCRLLHMFAGVPFVDVRASFNSFLPAHLPPELGQRLVDFYLSELTMHPELHDKVEFDIVISCYTFDLQHRLNGLLEHGFSAADCEEIAKHLRNITNNVIKSKGYWRADQDRLVDLDQRRALVLASSITLIEKVYWLLEDARSYGALPFAGLARSAFVAMQFLSSMVQTGLLEPEDRDAFLSSIGTVGSGLARDFSSLDMDSFLQKYGHLRPGTYDILSPRYDEAPSRYFDWSQQGSVAEKPMFRLRLDQIRRIDAALEMHGLEQDALGLFEFMQASIQGREYAKFVFTKNLSDALQLIGEIGSSVGIDKEAMSLIDIRDLLEVFTAGYDLRTHLSDGVSRGRAHYAETLHVALPPLLTQPGDVWSFSLPATLPNFITQSRVTGPVRAPHQTDDLQGSIVAIPSADPGFDWIFSRGIAGFVTAYGGVNSHMAIRAGELGIPAVIGAGEALFSQWASASRLLIDCANKIVERY